MRRVGVDIGATAVRVVEIDRIDQGFARIASLAVVPVPLGAVANGTLADPSVVAASLKLALERAKVRRDGLVLSVGSPDCALTSRMTPAKLAAPEREGILRNDAAPLSSRYPADELDVSAYVADTDGTTADTVVAVAREAVVAEYAAVCAAVKAVPRALDLTAASLARAIVRVDPDDTAAHTIIDIGASKTTIATRRGMHLRHVRTIEGGGNDITRAIAAVTGDDWETAESRKRNLRLVTAPGGVTGITVTGGYGAKEELVDDTPLTTTAAEDAYSHAVEALVEQIALSVEALRRAGDYPAALTLAGGASRTAGLTERLYQRLGIPVTVGRPWAELGGSRRLAPFRAYDTDQTAELMLSLAPAIGAALWSEPR